jgi:branched-chain amino acid transport system substrate-binding protein
MYGGRSPKGRAKAGFAAFTLTLLVAAGCGNRIPDQSAASAQSAPAAAIDSNGSTATTPAAAPGVDPAATSGAPSAAGSAATPAPQVGGSTAGGATASGAARASASAPAAANSGAASPRSAASAAPTGGQSSTHGAAGGPAQESAASPGSITPAPSGPCTKSLPPIVIGSVSTMSGFAGEAIGGGPKAVQAWASAVNATGGVKCHAVKYIIADDGGDPNRHQSLVQQLAERDKVIAFVYNAAPLSGYSSVNYINQKHIPVMGNEGGSFWFHDSPYFFPVGISGGEPFNELFFAAAAKSGSTAGKAKVALISCVEAPVCSGVDKTADTYAKKYGLNLVYKAQGTMTQPDYTSHCLSAMNAGAEIFIVSMEGNSVHRVARSCDSVGFHPIYDTVVSAIRVDFAQNPSLEGFVGGTHSLGWFVTGNPQIAQFQDALKKFAPGLPASPATASGWTTAKLFELAAQNVPEQPTSQSILDGLWNVKSNDLGGLTYPLTYNRDQKTPPTKCFFTVAVKKGQWTGGDKLVCV